MGVPWGDRTSLIDKAMVYAFSLEVRALSKGPYLTVENAQPKQPEDTDQYGVRHVFGETIVTMPEGLRCDVPMGYIEGGDGEIGDPNDSASCWLNLRVRSILKEENTKRTAALPHVDLPAIREVGLKNPDGHDTHQLHFAVNGVVNFDGGLSALRSAEGKKLTGQAFLSSCQEASTGTYRWLDRRQLFGVGRVEGQRKKRHVAPDEWVLDFSFDLYAAL